MPERNKNRADSPRRLQFVSDHEKCGAIALAYRDVAGVTVTAEIHRVDYASTFVDRGPFLSPARIVFTFSSRDASTESATTVKQIQAIPDQNIADVLARHIGVLAKEDYQGFVACKGFSRFPATARRRKEHSVTLLLARADAD